MAFLLEKKLVHEVIIDGFILRTGDSLDGILARNGFDLTREITSAPVPSRDAYAFSQSVSV